jgi:transposase-like protein
METKKKKKRLTDKQQMALELLTCGKGLRYKEIADAVGIDPKQLWRWRNDPDFSHFQEELKRINDERWLAIVDAARESAARLVAADNQKMTEFVLKNEGYNPTQKVEADISTDIVLNIGE